MAQTGSYEFYWTREKEEKLVYFWSLQPILFDVSHVQYRDRVAKEAILTQIAENLGTTVSQLKTRMTSLRTQFLRVHKPAPNGSSAKPLTEKCRWLKDKLQFLLPFIPNSGSNSSQTNLQVVQTGNYDFYWTREKEEQLVHLWSVQPILFDMSHVQYRDRVAKEMILTEIAEKLETTVSQLKTRMASLRTQFLRVHKPAPNGKTKPLTEKCRWLKDKLQFLLPFIPNSGSNSSQMNIQIKIERDDTSDDNEDNDELIQDRFTLSEEEAGPSSPQFSSRSSNITDDESILNNMPPKQSTKMFRRRKKDREVDDFDDLDKVSNAEAKKQKEDFSEKTENEAFIAFIGKSLQKFDSKTQAILRNQISNLIFKAEMGEIKCFNLRGHKRFFYPTD